jgi:hypothetical protein
MCAVGVRGGIAITGRFSVERTTSVDDEQRKVFDAMAVSDDVKVRGVGVIARFLGQWDFSRDPEAGARELIVETGQAGLITMIDDDLTEFIGVVKRNAAHRARQESRED